MYIKNVITHNWANLPDDVYTLGLLNLVTGGNGSGKTTFGDAIQTIMTATLHGLFHYNPGQDESSQQSKKKEHRTLASYVLGCDDGAWARTRVSDAFIVINWSPNPGESGKIFCCIAAARAHLEVTGTKRKANEDRLDFYLLPGLHLSIDDLKTRSGKNWLDLEKDLRNQLNLQYGKSNVEYFSQQKTHYLCRFYALLAGKEKGSLTAPEMKQRAKAFAKFMAYQPVDDLNMFVRESVLDAPDNETVIEEISSMMRNISSMRQEAEQINIAIGALEEGEQSCNSFIELWLKHQESYAIALRAKSKLLHREYIAAKQKRRTLEDLIEQVSRSLEKKRKDRISLQSQITDMKAKLRGTSWETKENLERQLSAIEKDISQIGQDLLAVAYKVDSAKKAILHLTNYFQNRSGTDGHQLLSSIAPNLLEAMSHFDALSGINQLIQLSNFNEEAFESMLDLFLDAELTMSDLYSQLNESSGDKLSVIDQLNQYKYDATRRYAELRKQQQDLREEVDRLKTRKEIKYPPATSTALTELKRKFPNCNPRIVGDHIEIRDSNWQNAIEGYLGGARFNIVVDPEFEADAIKLVRGLRNSAKVIQGEKARRDLNSRPLKMDSIVHFMDIDDELIRAYITVNYCNVETASGAEQLRGMQRGVTQDGMGCSSYSMYTCFIPDEDLVCGKTARERRLAAMENNLRLKSIDVDTASDIARETEALVEHTSKIVSLNAIEILELGLAAIQKKEHLTSQISSLDLSDIAEIESHLKKLEEDSKEVDTGIESENTNLGGYLTELYGHSNKDKSPAENSLIKLIDRLYSNHEKFAEDADGQIITYLDWRKMEDEFDEGAIIDAIEYAAQQIDDEEKVSELLLNYTKLGRLNQKVQAIKDQLINYNKVAIQQQILLSPYEELYETLVTDQKYFLSTRRLLSETTRLMKFLRNHILAKNIETLRKAQDAFDQTFTTNLVQQILSQIETSKKSLQNINKELESHKFDDETFEFIWDRQKEFKDYYLCFQELINLVPTRRSDIGSIFENDLLSEKSRDVLSIIKTLLLQNDDTKSKRELQRISDYRNYFSYDILKKPIGKEPIPLSTYGTGSGGQLETPFYVIMAAAFQSVLRFQEGNCHLRTIVIDESFSKLDEKRSRRILNYLAEKLGLQVIFIMPTVKSGPFKSICTNQLIMHKVHDPAPPLGSELKTKVFVDQQTISGEHVDALYECHRQMVTRQVQYGFLNLVKDNNLLDLEGKI